MSAARTEIQFFRAVLDGLATAPDAREAARRGVADATAGRLAADFPAYAVTVEPCWNGLAFHAVARAGADGPRLYAVVTDSEDQMRVILGGDW